MAWTSDILAIRLRPKGAEVVCHISNGNGTDRDFTFWYVGLSIELADLTAGQLNGLKSWTLTVGAAIRAAEQIDADEDADDETEMDGVTFWDWLKANKNDARLRWYMKPVVRAWREGQLS